MTPSWAHAVGLASDMAIMSLLALSAYLLLLVGRVSFGQQAFFGLGLPATGAILRVKLMSYGDGVEAVTSHR